MQKFLQARGNGLIHQLSAQDIMEYTNMDVRKSLLMEEVKCYMTIDGDI